MQSYIGSDAYEIIREHQPDKEVVRFQKVDGKATWTVKIGPDWRQCDCPDYRYRRRHAGERCKHLQFFEERMSTQPENQQPYLPALKVETLDETIKLAEIMFKSGCFENIRNAAQAVVKILAGKEMGFSPMASLMDVHIVEGKPSLGAHLKAAAIKRSGKYDYRVVERSDTACEIEFLEQGKVLGVLRYTLADCKEKKWHLTNGGKEKSPWIKTPANMLFARVIQDGYRTFTPDLTNGLVTYDPDEMDIVEPLSPPGALPALPAPAPTDNGSEAESAVILGERTASQVMESIDQLVLELKIPNTDFDARLFQLYGTWNPADLKLTELIELEGKLLAKKAEKNGGPAPPAIKSGPSAPVP